MKLRWTIYYQFILLLVQITTGMPCLKIIFKPIHFNCHFYRKIKLATQGAEHVVTLRIISTKPKNNNLSKFGEVDEIQGQNNVPTYLE